MAKLATKATVKQVLLKGERTWNKKKNDGTEEAIVLHQFEVTFETKPFTLTHFENGGFQQPVQTDKGYFSSSIADQKVFVVDKEVEFEYEIKDGKKSGDGSFYQYVKLFKKYEQRQGGGRGRGNYSGGGRREWKPEDKREGYPSFAVSYAKDLVIGGKIKIEQLPEEAEVLFDTMIALHKKLKDQQKGEAEQPQAQGNNNTAAPASAKSTSPPAAQPIPAGAHKVEDDDELPF